MGIRSRHMSRLFFRFLAPLGSLLNIRWRHIVPLLPNVAPLFVPDLPGYGASAPIEQNDKLSVGRVVLEALKSKVKNTKNGEDISNLKIILIGHDRGARVAHHLTVSGVEGIDILGVCLIDIVRFTIYYIQPNLQSVH
jgi:hypothetical protein